MNEISQIEADKLFSLEKMRVDTTTHEFPGYPDHGRLSIDLKSKDKAEDFVLTIVNSRIEISKYSYQNLGRKTVILARLDIDGPPHRNPDNETLPCPHLHYYREGYGDKWAMKLPDCFSDCNNAYDYFQKFMEYCNIIEKPLFEKGLF